MMMIEDSRRSVMVLVAHFGGASKHRGPLPDGDLDPPSARWRTPRLMKRRPRNETVVENRAYNCESTMGA